MWFFRNGIRIRTFPSGHLRVDADLRLNSSRPDVVFDELSQLRLDIVTAIDKFNSDVAAHCECSHTDTSS